MIVFTQGSFMTVASMGVGSPTAVDDGAFPEFYRRYSGPLRCYLEMGFRDTDVDGIAQDSFCRALSHWDEVGQLKNPWPWLAVTARNLARNNIRDELGSQAVGLQVFDRSTSNAVDVAELAEAADQLHRLAQAMDVLTPLQRQLLTVLVEEGLTGAEAARRLGMQPGAVRMHLCRMRARLSERFISLGGQLAVAPIAVVQLFGNRLARRVFRPQNAPLAAEATAFALSVAVVAVVAIGGVTIGPALRVPAPADSVTVVLPLMAAAAARPPSATRLPSRDTDATSRPVAVLATPGAPAVAYHLVLSSTPTRPGKTADARVEVATPVGTFHVSVPVIMQSPEPGSRCPLVVSC